MITLQRCFAYLLVLSIVAPLASANSRSAPGQLVNRKRAVVRLVFDKSDLKLGSNQTVEIRAKALDASDKEIPNPRIKWNISGSGKNSVTLSSLNEAQTDMLVSAGNSILDKTEVTLHAQAGSGSADIKVQLQNSTPAEIVFPDGNKVELSVQGHVTLKAYVLDANGNRIDNANINWSLADPDQEAFVLVGSNVNKSGVNTVEIAWLGGKADLKVPSQVKLIARSGDRARGVATIEYKAPAPETLKVSTDAKQY